MSNYCTAIFSYRDMKQSSLHQCRLSPTWYISFFKCCELWFWYVNWCTWTFNFFVLSGNPAGLLAPYKCQCAFLCNFLWYLPGFNSNPDLWMLYICTFLNVGDYSKLLCSFCLYTLCNVCIMCLSDGICCLIISANAWLTEGKGLICEFTSTDQWLWTGELSRLM